MSDIKGPDQHAQMVVWSRSSQSIYRIIGADPCENMLSDMRAAWSGLHYQLTESLDTRENIYGE